jgi:transcriptional regulator with GAF, ATPase, and Fis domain
VPTANGEARFYGEVDRRTGYRTESVLASSTTSASFPPTCIVVMDGDRLGPADLPLPERPLPIGRTPGPPSSLRAPDSEGALASRVPSLDEVERRHIARVMRHADGNQTLAARLLGHRPEHAGAEAPKFRAVTSLTGRRHGDG